MDKSTIFFSYSRPDSDFALKLAQDLRDKGVQLWIDQLDIKGGSRWDSSVETALNSATSILVILTPTSVNSNNVMDEVSFALENNKPVVPIFLIQCVIPFRLRRLQYVDFTKNYQKGFNQLLESLPQIESFNENLVQNDELKSKNNLISYQEILSKKNDNSSRKINYYKSAKFMTMGAIFILTFLGIIWTVNNKSINDYKSWNTASNQNDSMAYANYLEKYPNGKYVLLANRKLDSITLANRLKDSIAAYSHPTDSDRAERYIKDNSDTDGSTLSVTQAAYKILQKKTTKTDVSQSGSAKMLPEEVINHRDELYIISPNDKAILSYPRETSVIWNSILSADRYILRVEYSESLIYITSTTTLDDFTSATFLPLTYKNGIFRTTDTTYTFTGVGLQVHRFKVIALKERKIIVETPWRYIGYKG